MATIKELWTAFEEAEGRWEGCNWPTDFGSLRLDLNGITSQQAKKAVTRWRGISIAHMPNDLISSAERIALSDMAMHLRLRGVVACLGEGKWSRGGIDPTPQACAEALAQEWEVAAYLLAEIEAEARSAEQEAWDAVRSAENGDWLRALRHVRQASAIESGYDAQCLWTPLKVLIEQTAAQAGAKPLPESEETPYDLE